MEEGSVQVGQAEPPASAIACRPTRARYGVVLLTLLLSLVTYIDRVAISQAAPFLASEFGLGKIQLGWVFSAFALAYALFEIPGGWLGDWLGPRRVLTRIVIWWSFFTAATGWTWNFASLLATRFLFGAGEAGCYPNIAKVLKTWLPPRERPAAQGLMWLFSRWAGAFTPVLALWLIRAVSWRFAFQAFGLLGVIWAIAFRRWYRESPREHSGVNAAELALIGCGETPRGVRSIPVRRFLRSPIVWLLWLQYFAVSWGWSFYITWLPTYVLEGRAAGLDLSARLSTLPLFLGGFGCLLGGMLIPVLARRLRDAGAARGALGCLGCASAGILLLVSLDIREPVQALVVIGLASFANDISLTPAWEACMDVGGAHTGSLSGSMNMVGNLAGFFAPAVVGYLLTWTHQNWVVPFYISAGFYFLGALAWAAIGKWNRTNPERSHA